MRKLALLLAAIMVCGTACASNQNPSVSSQESSTSSVPEQSSSSTDNGVVKLNVFKSDNRPMNDQTETIRQYAIDNLKVDIEMNQIAENYNQQLALMITSGDIPDVMLLDYNTYLEYAKQGAFADISGHIQNYENLLSYVGDYWDPVKVDGAVYAVPSLIDVPTNIVTAIRKDWLDNVKLPVPQSLEEYTEVLRAFTRNDPDQNGKDDTFGMCGAGFMYLSPFFGAFGATTEQYYFLNDNNTITTNVISDGYREALKYLSGLYGEGLIDPEFFTATNDQTTQKWGRGEFGVWPSWWSHAGNAILRYGFSELQPRAQVETIYPPVGKNGQQGCQYRPPFDTVIALSHTLSPEKMDAALRLLDFQSTDYGFYVFMFGLEDVGFEMDDNGVITWYYGFDGKDRLGNEVTDMEVYKLLYNEKLQRYADSLSDDPSSVIYWKATEVQYDTPSRPDLFAYTRTQEYVENNAELTKFFTENSIRFIMGDKNIDTDWDKYVSDYLSMGGDLVRQSMLKAYNETEGTNYTFAE